MFVVGRVLDPEGKPVPNAMTMVHAAIKQPGSGGGLVEKRRPSAIGQASSDGSGRFLVDALRTSSSRHHQIGVVALAPGFGVGWAEFDPDVDQPAVDITLRPEQVIQGRLFDLNGRPVPGVEVVLQNMGRVIPADLTIRRPESIDGPWFWWNPRNNFPAWPKPAISDAEGRFTIRGAGRDLQVILMIDDPRFARQRIKIDTDGASESKPVTLALEPARIIRGRITDADTACTGLDPGLHRRHRPVDRLRGRCRGTVPRQFPVGRQLPCLRIGSRTAALSQRLEIVQLAQGGSRVPD